MCAKYGGSKFCKQYEAGTQKLTYTKAKQKLLAVAIFATLGRDRTQPKRY